MLREFVADESAQDIVEYALLTSLLAVVSIAALKFLGARVAKSFGRAISNL
jgi:Flp pilus assembly pilin Flp